MRHFQITLFITAFILYAGIMGCDSTTTTKKETITEMPITTSNKEAEASFKEGLVYFDQGDGLKAKALFAKAIEQDQNMAIAHLYYSFTATTPKEYNEELAKAKANLSSASDWEKDYYDFALSYNNEDRDKRIAVLEKIAKAYPDAARAHLNLGQGYEENNEFAKAREHYQKAIDLNSKWVRGYYSQAYSYLFSIPKDFKKAEENAIKAGAIAPGSAGIQILLGDCYRAQDSMQKAQVAYDNAVKIAPDLPEAYYKRGHTYSFTGKMNEARADYAMAGKLDQSMSGAILNIANTYLYDNNVAAALQYYNGEIKKLDSSKSSPSVNNLIKLSSLQSIASIALHIGDTATLQKAITMRQPLSSEVNVEVGTEEAKITGEASSIYWQALLDALKGNYDAAKTKSEEMKKKLEPIKNSRKLEDYEFLQGFVSFRQKDFPGAIAHFEKADQNDIYNKYWLARANEAGGNADKAKAIYKEVAVYNFNSTGFALVRNEAKKKTAM
ncbi:MAG: tetratricopeptide repeat protein [Chitinophagaceae bacterium]